MPTPCTSSAACGSSLFELVSQYEDCKTAPSVVQLPPSFAAGSDGGFPARPGTAVGAAYRCLPGSWQSSTAPAALDGAYRLSPLPGYRSGGGAGADDRGAGGVGTGRKCPVRQNVTGLADHGRLGPTLSAGGSAAGMEAASLDKIAGNSRGCRPYHQNGAIRRSYRSGTEAGSGTERSLAGKLFCSRIQPAGKTPGHRQGCSG